MFWGNSSALDLYEEYMVSLKNENSDESTEDNASGDIIQRDIDKQSNPKAKPRVLNVLLFGSNDPRHVIKTMAKQYQHKTKDGKNSMTILNFYLLDGCIEVVARNIALLSIALEDPNSLNLLNKVHNFMDIYGNSLIRPSSYHYLIGKSKSLLNIVTNGECLQQLAPILNIDNLTYKERDGLENTFNFWLPKIGNIYEIQNYWSNRVRQSLGTRYDYREGAFDWDLNMVLKQREGQQICSQEYRYWRETGIAFTYPEYEYSKPNKTFAVGLIRNGDKYTHRGYVGDIQAGPFAAFGLNCSDKTMLKSIHGENDYRSTDITERNLLELFHEIATGTPYNHDVNYSRKYGCIKLLMGKRLINNEYTCGIDLEDYSKPWMTTDGIKIHLLSSSMIYGLQNPTERWRNMFDVVFVSNNYFPFLTEAFVDILRENALLILETKLLSTARKDDVDSFEEKLLNYAKSIQLTNVINYNALNSKNFILKFTNNLKDQN